MIHSPSRKDFPSLNTSQISYLDSASSCQTPQVVIDAISQYLSEGHGNPHRGMYPFSEKAESIIGDCRQAIAKLVNCQPPQVAFTKGTTESLNLVAYGLADKVSHQQTIVVTQMEHHANLLPWQRLSQQTGAKLCVIPINADGSLNRSWLDESTFENCAIFACTHTSNLTGAINPIEQLIALAKSKGAITIVDGAQSIAHQTINFENIDCDFFAFSGHKLYGPSGIGCLIIKHPSEIKPLLLGGGIVNKVTNQNYQLTDQIHRFEAGSINMVGIVGLAAAIDYFNSIDKQYAWQQEKQLVQSAKKIVDPDYFHTLSQPESANILSIVSHQFHSHDIATILADNNVAVRAGHHCAQPYLRALGFKHCVRLSFAIYNDQSDIDRVNEALQQVVKVLS